MAPLPPESTLRYKVEYGVNAQVHTMEVRATGAESPSTFGTHLDAVLTALAPLLFQVNIVQVSVAVAGSTIFNPVTTGIESNTYGTGAGNAYNIPFSFSFVGRTSGGRRSRFVVYGANLLDNTYRVDDTEEPDVGTVATLINSYTNAWIGIDGLKPVWKSYANMSVNAYWQRHRR